MATKKNKTAVGSVQPLTQAKTLQALMGQMSHQGQAMFKEVTGALKRPSLMCENGLRMSVQASHYVHCMPRSNQGPYETVECGYPNREIIEFSHWAEDADNPTESIYSNVPLALVALVIARSGCRAPEEWKARSLLSDSGPLVLDPGLSACSVLDGPWSQELARTDCQAWMQAAVLGSPSQEDSARAAMAARAGGGSWEHVFALFEQACLSVEGWGMKDVTSQWAGLCFAAWECSQMASASAAVPKGVKAKRSI